VDDKEEDFISDDGMRFDEDGHASGSADESSDDEVEELEAEGEAEISDEATANASLDGADDEKRTGTKPRKPPTGEELRNIKDATDLYRSSSFKLQVSVYSSYSGRNSSQEYVSLD
jgi:U3 small nucleolar RNA-associated protein 22